MREIPANTHLNLEDTYPNDGGVLELTTKRLRLILSISFLGRVAATIISTIFYILIPTRYESIDNPSLSKYANNLGNK